MQQTGTLLIADEVQCGLGRTGQPFYFQKLGMRPDLVSVGKALAGGVPMGAALVNEEVAAALAFGDHGTTFGGNLLACRAALVCLDELDRRADGSREEGRRASRGEAARDEEEASGDRRGPRRGPDVGPRAERWMPLAVHEAAIRQGVLVNRTAGKVIRLLPPLMITEAELDRALGLLDAAFSEVFAGVDDMKKSTRSARTVAADRRPERCEDASTI